MTHPYLAWCIDDGVLTYGNWLREQLKGSKNERLRDHKLRRLLGLKPQRQPVSQVTLLAAGHTVEMVTD